MKMVPPLELRPYQLECLDHAKTKNTIVHLPTGFGKTLIAARLCEYFRQHDPNRVIGFLVPTRALANQQSEYLRDHCRLATGDNVIVETLIGEVQASWTKTDWIDASQQNDIFCGTAAVFQKALITDGYLSVDRFSLLIFDECHNATGNSPMASVMRDSVAPYYVSSRSVENPRILGLTASFDNGNSKNLVKKRRQIETLLQATIICPKVEERFQDDKFHHIHWDRNAIIDEQKERIEDHTKYAVQELANIKDISKVIKRCSHVFEELGRDAVLYYVDKVIVKQVTAKIDSLNDRTEDPSSVRYAEKMNQRLPELSQQLSDILVGIRSDPILIKADSNSQKVKVLFNLLGDIFNKHPSGYQGIVFVEQVSLVSTLAKLLNDRFCSLNRKFGAVAGNGHQTEADRQFQLNNFAESKIDCLVSTAALEEGIDVSKCGFVVRFTSISTTKAHIQGTGRARHKDAEIFYFDNDPSTLRRMEVSLNGTARNQSLSLSETEIQSSTSSICMNSLGIHPYPTSAMGAQEGQVNVYNCIQIFNQYCSMVLGSTVQPKVHLYRYLPPHPENPKAISKIWYPTPNGWQSKSIDDFQQFWKAVTDRSQIFNSTERVKRKTASEMDEMMFVYMVVVTLRQEDHLDAHNRPQNKMETRRSCRLVDGWPNDNISINNPVFQSYGSR